MTNLERIEAIIRDTAGGRPVPPEGIEFLRRLYPVWVLYAMRERQAFSIEEACNLCEVDRILGSAAECGLEREAPSGQPRAASDAKATGYCIEQMQAEVGESLVLAEGEIATERLSGNAAKLAFWQGEQAALNRMRTILETAGQEEPSR